MIFNLITALTLAFSAIIPQTLIGQCDCPPCGSWTTSPTITIPAGSSVTSFPITFKIVNNKTGATPVIDEFRLQISRSTNTSVGFDVDDGFECPTSGCTPDFSKIVVYNCNPGDGKTFPYYQDVDCLKYGTHYYTGRTSNGINHTDYSNYGTFSVQCIKVSGVYSSNISQTSAKITWNSSCQALDYTLRYKPASGSWASVSVSATSGTTVSKTLTGLQCGTNYSIEVINNCTSSVSSATSTASFNTLACSGCVVEDPDIYPNGGSFSNPVTVSMSCATAGATIHYTTNGTTPTCSSQQYTGSFIISSSATVKAIACKTGCTSSWVTSETYTINSAPSTGSITTYIYPLGLAGAAWQINGSGNWYTSGNSVGQLYPGSYTINFKPVTGYITPQPISTTVTANNNQTISGTYQQIQSLSNCGSGCNQSSEGYNNLRLEIISEQTSDYKDAKGRIQVHGSNIPKSASFNWSRARNASKYTVELADANGQAILGAPYINGYVMYEVNDNGKQILSYRISSSSILSYSSTYKVKVQAYNAANEVIACQVKTFTVMSPPPYNISEYRGVVNHVSNVILFNNCLFCSNMTVPWTARHHQCTDYTRRFYKKTYNLDTWRDQSPMGSNAYNLFQKVTDNPDWGLIGYKNNGSQPLQEGSIICYGGTTTASQQGHVAIIREILSDKVYLAQQNTSVIYDQYDGSHDRGGFNNNVLVSARKILGLIYPNLPRIKTIYQNNFPIALDNRFENQINIPSNKPIFYWNHIKDAIYFINLKKWNGTCYVDYPSFSGWTKVTGTYLNAYSFKETNNTLENGEYQICVKAKVKGDKGELKGEFYYFTISPGSDVSISLLKSINSVIKGVGSTMFNARFITKHQNDTLFTGKTGITGNIDLFNDEIITPGDSIIIKNSGYLPTTFAIDSSFIKQSYIPIPLFKDTSFNGVNTLSVSLLNNFVNQTGVFKIKITGKNMTGFDIIKSTNPYIYDSLVVQPYLFTDSIIDYLATDTGINYISIRAKGIDSLEVSFPIGYYYPGTEYNSKTSNVNISAPEDVLPCDLFLDGDYFKTITSSYNSLRLPINDHVLQIKRFGFNNLLIHTDSAQNLPLIAVNLIPRDNYLMSDTLLVDNLSPQKTAYKNAITLINQSINDAKLSLKRGLKDYSSIGIINVSDSYILRDLDNFPNSINSIMILHQRDFLSDDSIYLLNAFSPNQFSKYPIDSTSKWRYDSAFQKLSVNNISFKSGSSTYEEYVLAKKLAPLPKSSGLHIWEDRPAMFHKNQFCIDPDSIADLLVEILSLSPSNLTLEIIGDSVRLTPALNFFGNSSITVDATHDWISKILITPIIIHPLNDPPVFTDVPDLSLCANETNGINLNPYLSDVDNTNDELFIEASIVGTSPGGNPADLQISINQANNSLSFTSNVLYNDVIYYVRLIATDDSLASDTTIMNVIVYGLPNPQMNNLNTDYCIDDEPILIQGNLMPFGSFTGIGITDLLNGTAIFNPIMAGIGGPYTISYSYTNTFGCNNNHNINVTVHDLPQVSITGLDNLFCDNVSPVLLSGNHPGGIFSGNGVINSITPGQAWFQPEIMGLGGPLFITYTYTDQYGCTNSSIDSTYIIASPSLKTIKTSNISCNGANDGSIFIEVQEGTLPYSIHWSNGSSSNSQSNLVAGTYVLQVNDNNQCGFEKQIIIAQPNTFGLFTDTAFWDHSHSSEGSLEDRITSTKTDNDGNILACGTFTGTTTLFGVNVTSFGQDDIFLAKFSPAGDIIWIKTAGGTSNEKANSISTDKAGNIYISGYYTVNSFFDTANISSNGGTDVFVASYNPSGQLRWVSSIGGFFDDYSNSLYSDPDGRLWLCGSFQGMLQTKNKTLISNGGDDVLIAHLTAMGDVKWINQAGGTSQDFGRSIYVDALKNALVTGEFQGTALFGTNALNSSGNNDIFIAKYNRLGDLSWVRKAGGSGNDIGKSISGDFNGNVYCGGTFEGTASFNATNIISKGYNDVFVSKHDTYGNLKWVKSFGGTETDNLSSLTNDALGNAFIAGNFRNQMTLGDNKYNSQGLNDVFVAAINKNGLPIWSQIGGGLGNDSLTSISIHDNGNIIVGGSFNQTATFGNQLINNIGSVNSIFAVLSQQEISSPPQIIQPDCFWSTNGQIDISPGGGTKPFSFLWSTGSTNEDIINAPTGTYWLFMEDDNGCEFDTAVVLDYVFPFPEPPTSASVDRNFFCTNDAGNITLTAVGGSGDVLEWYENSCGG
ncbi:MAG: chitobiase/beta-hexosaminidase C-terminal domain-containing protein, partial [Bacteroidales bacterium]|nr:chitobiase/beta-hexosaminidase C-terminal domain-containing protein [Bacteroidales bacterium]